MGGQGNFNDPRIDLEIAQRPDLITRKLAALSAYQLGLKAPEAPKRSFNRAAANRGKRLFRNEARLRVVPSGAAVYRRAERPGSGRAVPP